MSLAHLTLASRDVQRTADFFEQTLGWKRVSQAGNIDTEAVWLAIDDRTQLHILRVDDFEASPFEREYGRHFAFFCPACDWVALQQRLRAAGAEIVAPLRPTPFRRFFFRDWNGYVFEIIDQDQFVQEKGE